MKTTANDETTMDEGAVVACFIARQADPTARAKTDQTETV